MAASNLGFSQNAFFESLNPLLVRLKKRFDARAETLAFAESCTGGLLSAAVTSLSGASSFYLGGVVSYHRNVKNKILRVPMPTIDAVGEVSPEVAIAMARGAQLAVGSTWAVGVTGVAGPTGGTPKKPVGMVCFGFAGPGIAETRTQIFEVPKNLTWSRQHIQQHSVTFAVSTLLEF